MIQKFITDLGAAAYLMMHKYRVVGKRGKSIYFEVTDAPDAGKFDELYREYLTGEFHRFDACIMSLKKMGDFDPGER